MSGFRKLQIDLNAVSENVRALRAHIGTAYFLAVVKADGYGHGAVPMARAAIRGGADWLGTADLDEALAVREAGLTAPLLCWLHGAHTDFAPAIAADIDVAVSSLDQLERVAIAAAAQSRPGTVHLKIDTGLSRNGIAPELWTSAITRAAELERSGQIRVRGIMSHLANTDAASDAAQLARFDAAIAQAHAAGLEPSLFHIAATAAAIATPEARYNLVRIGIGLTGLSPFSSGTSAALGLTPAMSLSAEVIAVREVPAGAGVSYGFTYRTTTPTRLALIPLGYGDGVPRQASNAGTVVIAGERYRVAGRIAMDQFLVDVGSAPVAVGDIAVLFGDPATGAPDVREWAEIADSINYEVVTRMGSRPGRSYVGADLS